MVNDSRAGPTSRDATVAVPETRRRAAFHGAGPALAILLLTAAAAPARADCEGLPGVRCDPPGPSRSSSSGTTGFRAIDIVGDYASPSTDAPATLGAITFHGNGTRCIGLLRRGSCK